MNLVIAAPPAKALLDRVRGVAGAASASGEAVHVHVARGEEALLPLMPEADAFLAGRLTPRLVAAAPRLRWVQATGAGVEDLLFPELVAREEIVLTNARGAHHVAMPEYVLMAMLSWTHHLPALLHAQERREWIRPMPDEVYGKTLGLLGYGEIGRAIAARVTPLGVRCLACRRNAAAAQGSELVERTFGPEELHQFLGACDFVVNSLPVTDETRGVIGERELRAMRPAAVLIHLGRGPTVRQDALLRALRERWIAGAFLDVFDEEPLPSSSPFWTLENAILTSHTAGDSVHYQERSFAIFLDNLQRFLAGQPLRNVVDKRLGY